MAEKRGSAKNKSKKTTPGKKTSKKISKKHSKSKARPKKQRRVRKLKHVTPGKLEVEIGRPPHELEEEFFIPSPIHRGRYHIPLGIRFLIGYLLFLTVLYLISFIYGITFPTTILFGKMIVGARALIINSVLLALILAMVYGFWKRKAYTFDLSVSFFSFAALNAIISLLLFDSAEHPMFRKLLLLSFVSLVVMNIIIVWYILHERKYFYSERFKDRPFHHRDKVFLYTIITFWVVVLLLGGTIGAQFYKDTKSMIDDTLKEMRGDYYRGQLVCDAKEGPEKDVCNLVLATALSTKQRPADELKSICDRIESEFYSFTCMRSISG
ncbi:hypothetical protein KY362_00895 [Candidatus Woesearchaeota archaeon]|nr:hypothetical protein [Candidatus Woesearchaeota archaeon]